MKEKAPWPTLVAVATLITYAIGFFIYLRDAVIFLWKALALDETEPTTAMVTAGVLMIGSAIFGLLLGPATRSYREWKRQREARKLGQAYQPPRKRRLPRILLIALALTGTAVAAVGLAGGPDKVLELLRGLFSGSGNDPGTVPLDGAPTVWSSCAGARETYRGVAARRTPSTPAGTWKGTATWLRGTQTWTFSGRTISLTGGYQGKWEQRGKDHRLVVRFGGGTVFEAQMVGEMLCGLRYSPDGDNVPDGSFVLTLAGRTPADRAREPESIPEWVKEVFENEL
ncbi:hypothetical protein ACFQ1E_03965 [Sphingomonas canadensis]|uniref:Uncharacterized protein n=1 Tax=Sphingomonas canadensis TaxID=1219257 RepID=A0ABW3H480_9SPHN|nr:hypothetical protein [Sphingomonas canadensis]MCW3834600.1 hypothetical protein [Sphingomonas canadensis]